MKAYFTLLTLLLPLRLMALDLPFGLYIEQIPDIPDNIRPFSFQLAGIAVFQSGGGNSFSTHMAWSPVYALGEDDEMGIRGEIGFTLLKRKGEMDARFVATNWEVFFWKVFAESIVAQAGGGLQFFHGVTGYSGPIIEFGAALPVGQGVASHIFLTVSHFFLVRNASTSIKLGVGFVL